MITRRAAEQQADRCFMYHIAAYGAVVTTMALTGSRSTKWLAGVWGLGVLLHGTMLYAVPEAREQILRLTASGMEDLQHYHQQTPELTHAESL